MLEQSDIAHYLLSLGLVKPRDVVEEDLVIADASRRNSVLLASTRAGPTFVVKQAGPRTAETLAHEAAVLHALAGMPEIAGTVPAVVHHEPAAHLLVLRTPAGGRDWGDHRGRFPRSPPRTLGRMLGGLHRLPVDAVEASPDGVDRMWALSFPEPSHELMLDLSAAAQDLIARVQASRQLCHRLQRLRAMAEDDVLVHGDLRWANCLTFSIPGSRRRTRLMLIDWEVAGPGPAAFDVGTVLAEYLGAWITSIPIVEPADPGRLVARARLPLARMRPAVHDFWAAYRLANPLCPALRRVMELAAVRLLQSAVEHAQGLAAPTAHVVTLLQLADNMLRHPEEAALTLLALRE
jgi:Ser/Thr protein kinase RdoA (MazF antagonist)